MLKVQDIAVRRACLSDRREVLSMTPPLFEGMDYLPAMYNILLQDKNFWGYVALVNGQMASFSAFYMDHEEKFFGSVSARTNPKFLGLKLSDRIMEVAYEDMRRSLTGKYVAYWLAADKAHVFTSKYWSNPDTQLLRRDAFLSYIVPSLRVQRAAQRGAIDSRLLPIKVKLLNNDEALKLLMDQKTQDFVLKDSVIVAFNNALPITRHPKYLKQIITQSVVCASYKSDGITPWGISHSTLVPAECGVISNINLHVYEHVDIALAHLTQHFAETAQVVDDDVRIGFRIIFPADIDKEVIKEFLLPDFGHSKVSKVHPKEYSLTAMETVTFSKL